MESTIQREATLEDAIKLGLTKDEFETIKKVLGRTPNYTETSIYGFMWSEHCSYRNAVNWLKALPKVEENSGITDLGGGMQCVLKIETQKRPYTANSNQGNTSYVEPIAQMSSFRFGNIEKDETKNSLKEVTKAISDSANTSGITALEGDVFFDDSFSNNPIVNTFSVGFIDTKKTNSVDSKIVNPTYTLDFCSEKIINDICTQFNLKAEEITAETDTKNIRYFHNKELIADLPIDSLNKDGETLNKEVEVPAYFQESKKFSINDIKEPEDLKEAASFLLKHPNIASRRWINNQFNSLKRTGANINKAPADAGIVPLKDTDRALAMSIGGNSRYINADPKIGTSIAVAEAARNIVCAGGTPTAITSSLNISNPNKPESHWQFSGIYKGLSAASLKFKTPITGGNISFSNEKGAAISLSATIGMVGLLEDENKSMSLDFKHKGDLIFILGEAVECIASSEYLYSYHGVKESPAPYFNIEKEVEMQEIVKSLIKKGLVNAAHDCSTEGVFIALTEMSMPNELGFDIVTDAEIREDAFLFGEAAGRVLVGVNEESEDAIIEFMMDKSVNFTLLGHVTQGKMVVDDEHYGFIQAAKKSYNSALESLIN